MTTKQQPRPQEVEGRACGFVVGVVTCAFLVALLYFGLQWALSGYPE
jgi:hypothetical protein